MNVFLRLRCVRGFAASSLLWLLAFLWAPSVVWAAECDAGAGTISVEQKDVGAEAWRCLGTYHRFAELAPVLARAPRAALALRVNVGPGRFQIEQPLSLDGAKWKGVAIEITGAGADRSTVIGSVPVGSATVPWSVPLDAAALKRYLETNHGSQAASTPHDLLFYEGDDRIVPGRWPVKGWGQIAEANRDGDLWRLRLADGAGHPPALTPGPLRLAGFPGFDWAYMSVPAQAISADTVTVSATALNYPAKPRQRVTLEAARGDLVDARIVVDEVAGTVGGPAGRVYDWARTATFLQANGMSNLKVGKIGLTGFSGDAITLANSTDVVLSDLDLSRIGGHGVVIMQGKRILVDHSRIRFMGEGGVDAGGGNRITLEPSDITISNIEFERFSEIVMGYRPAVHIYGVGAKILNNRMHDAPHSAILFDGNDHLIQGNVIYDVAKEVRDSGAIYTWRDWTTYGTIIEENIIAHLHSRADLPANGMQADTNAVRGIYLDDFTSGITIQKNIFYDMEYGIFLNGGSDVKVTNNIFIRTAPPFSIYPIGLLIPRASLGVHNRAVSILLDLKARSSVLLTRFPQLQAGIDELIVPRGNQFTGNVLVDSPLPTALRNKGAFMDLSNPNGRNLVKLSLPDPTVTPNALQTIRKIIDLETTH